MTMNQDQDSHSYNIGFLKGYVLRNMIRTKTIRTICSNNRSKSKRICSQNINEGTRYDTRLSTFSYFHPYAWVILPLDTCNGSD